MSSGPWMQTWSGGMFFPLEPREEDIVLGDIAHALAHLCRFGGHVRRFYSVAEHSVHVSRIVPAGLAMTGLLHYASEAYLIDLPRPIKIALPAYRKLEQLTEQVIGRRFGIELASQDALVKKADLIMLATERRDLMPEPPRPYASLEGISPSSSICVREPWTPEVAKAAFLQRFEELGGVP